MNPIVIIGFLVLIILVLFGEKLFMKANELLWGREKPEKINGIKVRLGEFDWLGPVVPDQLIGTISDLSDNRYRIDFDEPLILHGKKVRYAIVVARHTGYPVSRMSRRGILAVSGEFESGEAFIALIAKAK